MRQSLLSALVCPRCGASPLRPDGVADPLLEGVVACPQGHAFDVRAGVLQALVGNASDIELQISENARERRGDLSEDEKEAYRRNISQIGLKTYNRLIRENASSALDAIAVRGGRSLDLGGGSGWLAVELARRGFEAVSLDIEDPHERAAEIEAGAVKRDFELVTDLEEKPDARTVDYIVGDMDHLPFADATFDLVTTSAALHHASDPVSTLREAARVLRPGGDLLALNEPVKGVFRDEAPILGGRGSGAGEHLYWAGSYLRFFREAGLDSRLHFPGWIDRRLRGRDWEGVVYYRRLLPLVGALWALPGVRPLVRGPLLRPALDLFGLTLICEGRKPNGISPL